MKTFRVFVHPVLGLEAVKSGFSWPAFFFASAWMLEKKLWGLAALWFGLHAIVALLGIVPGADAAALSILMVIGLELVAGANGNRWREQRLLEQRYQPLTTVTAYTPYEAVERAFGFTRRSADFTVHA